MITKSKLINHSFIPLFTIVGVVLGIQLFGEPTLPNCDNESRVNLNLSRMFKQQVEQGGAAVMGLHITNVSNKPSLQTEMQQCVSKVTVRAEQEGRIKKFAYEVDFNIKWYDKKQREYMIELTKLVSLPEKGTSPNDDIADLSTLTQPVADTQDIQHHDILFFATLKEGDGFVTLFKDSEQMMFIIGGKEGANHHLVSPTPIPSSAAGGSTQFEADGVIYRIEVDGLGGATLQIHDDSGVYTLPLDTESHRYINRLPPLHQS